MSRPSLLRRVRELGGELDAARDQAESLSGAAERQLITEYTETQATIRRRWCERREQAVTTAVSMGQRISCALDAWSSPRWQTHEPPPGMDFPAAVRIGVAGGDHPISWTAFAAAQPGGIITPHAASYPAWERSNLTSGKRADLTTLPVPSLPLLAGLCADRGFTVLVPATDEGARTAAEAVMAAVWRLVALASPAPGAYELAMFETELLGGQFRHLLDIPPALRGNRIASTEEQVVSLLSRLRNTAAEVIQEALGSRYDDLFAYNAAFPAAARPFRVLIGAGYPKGFTHESAALLTMLLTSGPRAGVTGILVARPDAPAGYGVTVPFAASCRMIVEDPARPGVWRTPSATGIPVKLDGLPPASLVQRLVQTLDIRLKQNQQVPLGRGATAMPPAEWWTGSSADKIEAMIGLYQDGTPITVSFDGLQRNFGLVGGQTGHGKSNLFHLLILALTERYGPDELELYLVDLKQGVEFQSYANLPHAKAVLLEAKPWAGQAVLQRLHDILQERAALFKQAGSDVKSLRQYRQKTGKPMPRILMIMDEFQILLGDTALGPDAGLILEQLVQQGRTFGIHAILATQSITAKLNRWDSIESQIELRIALRCSSQAMSQGILGERNGIAATLTGIGDVFVTTVPADPTASRRGKIFAAGNDEPAQRTAALRSLAATRRWPGSPPWVLNGDTPPAWPVDALDSLRAHGANGAAAGRVSVGLLGRPFRIAPDVAIAFRREPGNAVMLFGDDDVGIARAMTSLALSCVQSGGIHLRALRFPSPRLNRDRWESMAEMFDRFGDRAVAERNDAAAAERLKLLAAETIPARRQSLLAGHAPGAPVMVLIPGLDGWDEAGDPYAADSAAAALLTVAREGPAVGIHLVLWIRNDNDGSRLLQGQSRELVAVCGHRIVVHCPQQASYELIGRFDAAMLDTGSAIYRSTSWPADRFERFTPYAIDPATVAAARVGAMV